MHLGYTDPLLVHGTQDNNENLTYAGVAIHQNQQAYQAADPNGYQQNYSQGYQSGHQLPDAGYQNDYNNHGTFPHNDEPSAPPAQKIEDVKLSWDVIGEKSLNTYLPPNQRSDFTSSRRSPVTVGEFFGVICNHPFIIIMSLLTYIPLFGLIVGLILLVPNLITAIISKSPVFIAGGMTTGLGLLIPSFVFSILAFIFYFCCVFKSKSASYLKNKVSTQDSKEYINSLRLAPPRLWMKCECFHWETRIRTVHYHDHQNRPQTRLETYQEKVTSYTEVIEFPYSYWADVSGVFRIDSNQAHKKYIKLNLKTHALFNDLETANAYTNMEREFHNRNMYRDRHISISQGMSIPNLQEALLTRIGDREPPLISWRIFLLGTILFPPGLFVIPYLWYFDSLSGAQDFTIFKRISLNPFVDMTQSNQHESLKDISEISNV